MAIKKRYTFYITDELDQGLKALKERDGLPEAEALRRALTAFLREKGVLDARPMQAATSKKGGKGHSSEMRSVPRRAQTPRRT